MVKRIARCLDVALLTACGFIAFDVASQIADESAEPEPGVVMASAEVSVGADEPAPPAWAERAVILDRNLFAAQTETAVPPPVSEPLEETELPIVLRGTLAADGDIPSRAAIYDKHVRNSQVLTAGEMLDGHPGVQVARIERRRVVLLDDGERTELRFPDSRIFSARPPARERRASRRSLTRNPEYQARLREIRQGAREGRFDAREMRQRIHDLRKRMR